MSLETLGGCHEWCSKLLAELSPVIKVKLEKDCPALLKPGGDLKSCRRCQCKKLKGCRFLSSHQMGALFKTFSK